VLINNPFKKPEDDLLVFLVYISLEQVKEHESVFYYCIISTS